jgi:hypothetical protein
LINLLRYFEVRAGDAVRYSNLIALLSQWAEFDGTGIETIDPWGASSDVSRRCQPLCQALGDPAWAIPFVPG